MLGDILNVIAATSGAPIQTVVNSKVTGGNGQSTSSSAPATTTTSGVPTWNTAYAGGNFTNNNLGNNTPDPSMQATLNDPHAAILAPPTTTVTTQPAPHPTAPTTGGGTFLGKNPTLPGGPIGPIGGGPPTNPAPPGTTPPPVMNPSPPTKGNPRPQPFSIDVAPATARYSAVYAKTPNRVVSYGNMTV